MSVSAQAAKNGSHFAREDRRKPESRRELGEADRAEAPLSVPEHLGRSEIDVGQPGKLRER